MEQGKRDYRNSRFRRRCSFGKCRNARPGLLRSAAVLKPSAFPLLPSPITDHWEAPGRLCLFGPGPRVGRVFEGPRLKDPKGLLCGEGKFVRHISLRKPSEVDEPAFRAPLKQAARWPDENGVIRDL